MALSDEDVREILRIIDESDLDELRIESEGFVLHVLKGGADPGRTIGEATSSPASTTDAHAAPGTDAPANGTVAIEAPMLGTFYRAEGPGQEPFVEVGSEVGPHTTVCIIEVMKMMNSVAAGVTGTIAEVCSQNAELVEYGEPLFRVQPAG
jgi:acetyl-CoA carboxylase biotin carboxyl carrier protein